MDLVKIQNGNPILVSTIGLEQERIDELMKEGYKSFNWSKHPDVPEGMQGVSIFEEKDGAIIQRWEIANNPEKVQMEIDALKLELQSEDYKIVKCYEAQLTGREMPYDVKSLVLKRDIIRNKINKLGK